jgi:hypothetical protein
MGAAGAIAGAWATSGYGAVPYGWIGAISMGAEAGAGTVMLKG